MDAAHGRGAGESPARPQVTTQAARSRLTRLSGDVERLRTRLAAVQTALRELQGIERTRPLAAAERQRVTRLRLESEGLRLELAALYQEFRRLRAAGPQSG
jgi:hypothetical protein